MIMPRVILVLPRHGDRESEANEIERRECDLVSS
jgi:hypothetical protein